jgi:hypothetical protein
MRTRTKNTVVLLAGSASLVAGLALWPSAAPAHADDDGSAQHEVVEGTFETEREAESFIDNDGNGAPSLGDELVYTDSGTGTLGTSTNYGHCVLHDVDLSADRATVHCISTSEFDRGSLTFQGTSRVGLASPVLREPASWAVTGGTGHFRSAHGELHITEFEGAGPDFTTSGTFRLVLGR